MPTQTRAGDVLAGRYELVDLLAESDGGRFWRATDRVLDRPVALHVIDSDDARADRLLEAARTAVAETDHRILKVLDAVREDDLVFIITEWGSGKSVDIMLAEHGPFAPHRAAWIALEVAESLASAHENGGAHGRLAPENVLIDHNGSVRVIGYAVEAALHGLPDARQSTDLMDLAGLLYAMLTSKWPGISRSQVPRAPIHHGAVLRPRKVRAGIPRRLDALCDGILNPFSEREDVPTSTAQVAERLAEFVGDATGVAEAEAARVRRPHPAGPGWTRPASPAPDGSISSGTPTERDADAPPPALGEPAAHAGPDAHARPAAHAKPAARGRHAVSASSGSLALEQTQAGTPNWDDDPDATGAMDPTWRQQRTDTPPPPEAPEQPAPKPLFAPDPAPGEPVRHSRRPVLEERSEDYWPWADDGPGSNGDDGWRGGGGHPSFDTGMGGSNGWPTNAGPLASDEEPTSPRSRVSTWLVLAGVVATIAVAVFAVAAVLSFGGNDSANDEPTGGRLSSGQVQQVKPLAANDLDPQGDAPYEENPELIGNVIDGRPATTWHTNSYLQNFGPSGLKDGVGIVLDLGTPTPVGEVDVRVVGGETSAALYLSDSEPTSLEGLDRVADGTSGDDRLLLSPDGDARGRYVVVWLNSIPEIPGGFRGEVSEITVRS